MNYVQSFIANRIKEGKSKGSIEGALMIQGFSKGEIENEFKTLGLGEAHPEMPSIHPTEVHFTGMQAGSVTGELENIHPESTPISIPLPPVQVPKPHKGFKIFVIIFSVISLIGLSAVGVYAYTEYITSPQVVGKKMSIYLSDLHSVRYSGEVLLDETHISTAGSQSHKHKITFSGAYQNNGDTFSTNTVLKLISMDPQSEQENTGTPLEVTIRNIGNNAYTKIDNAKGEAPSAPFLAVLNGTWIKLTKNETSSLDLSYDIPDKDTIRNFAELLDTKDIFTLKDKMEMEILNGKITSKYSFDINQSELKKSLSTLSGDTTLLAQNTYSNLFIWVYTDGTIARASFDIVEPDTDTVKKVRKTIDIHFDSPNVSIEGEELAEPKDATTIPELIEKLMSLSDIKAVSIVDL